MALGTKLLLNPTFFQVSVFERNGHISTATLFVICFADKSFGLAARPFASLDEVVLCHVGSALVFGFVAGSRKGQWEEGGLLPFSRLVSSCIFSSAFCPFLTL